MQLRAILFTICLLLVPALGFAHGYKVGDLVVIHPWSPAPKAGAKVAAGFMVIENKGSTPDRLVAVNSAVAGTIQIHSMSIENGVMKMAELPDGLEIPAGGKVELKPKGLHIMFIDLKEPILLEVPFDAELVFEKAGTVKVEFMVEDKPSHMH